jgi:hypothetical protein
VGLDDIEDQRLRFDGLAVGGLVGPLVVRDVGGGLALEAQADLKGLLLEVEFREADGRGGALAMGYAPGWDKR